MWFVVSTVEQGEKAGRTVSNSSTAGSFALSARRSATSFAFPDLTSFSFALPFVAGTLAKILANEAGFEEETFFPLLTTGAFESFGSERMSVLYCLTVAVAVSKAESRV